MLAATSTLRRDGATASAALRASSTAHRFSSAPRSIIPAFRRVRTFVRNVLATMMSAPEAA
jgi:hypothetical protein